MYFCQACIEDGLTCLLSMLAMAGQPRPQGFFEGKARGTRLIDYEQSLFFLQSVEQNARHANHGPRVWLPPSFRSSRGFAAAARVHSPYNTWRKRETARSLRGWWQVVQVISAWQGKGKSRQVIFQINQQLLSTDHQGVLLVLIICSN